MHFDTGGNNIGAQMPAPSPLRDPVTGLLLAHDYQLPRDSEIRLLAAIVEGGSIKGAAAVLGIAPGTVNSRLEAFRQRTGWTVASAVFLGARDGWLPVSRLFRQRPAAGQEPAAARSRVAASLLWEV